MKLSEIFTQLTSGELSQLNIGGSEQGMIDSSNYSAMVSHLNLGLTALYKRFFIKEGRLRVQVVPGRLTYPLTDAYAVSNVDSLEPSKYLLDSISDPFLSDILKIERVYSGSGEEFSLNDEADFYSVYTPTHTTLRLPAALVNGSPDLPKVYQGSPIEVVYRANHPKLEYTEDFDPDLVELELPVSYLEALLYFIASRVHNPIGMVNEFNAGNNWAAKYENECQRIELSNIRIDPLSSNIKLHRNGWV